MKRIKFILPIILLCHTLYGQTISLIADTQPLEDLELYIYETPLKITRFSDFSPTEQKWANPALSEKIVWANDGAGLFFDNDIVIDYKIFTPLNIIKDKIADKLGDDYISELIKEIIKESDKGANVAIGVEGVLTIDGAIAVINNGGDIDVNIRLFSTKNNGLFERDNSDSEWIPMDGWSRVQPTPKEIFHLEYTHNLK